MGLGAVGLTVAYGMTRLLSVGFQQLRDVVFAAVGQRALRQLALETFTHIHRLSLRYHITRKTGGLSRIIERGVKGVEFLLRFMLFSIGPLIVELFLIAEQDQLSLREIPVSVENRAGSSVRIVADFATLMRDLFRIRRWVGEGVYEPDTAQLAVLEQRA